MKRGTHMNHIVIADSHTLCREALCDYIRTASETITIDGVGNFESLATLLDGRTADLILIDSGLLQGGGTLSRLPSAKIGLLVTGANGSADMQDDVHGVFPKTLSCKAFLKGIEQILAGETFFPKADYQAAPYPGPVIAMPPRPQEYGLTGREREVLTFLVKGASNKDIARALNLQVVTVKLHVRGICRKLNAANRTQAALAAKENGWN